MPNDLKTASPRAPIGFVLDKTGLPAKDSGCLTRNVRLFQAETQASRRRSALRLNRRSDLELHDQPTREKMGATTSSKKKRGNASTADRPAKKAKVKGDNSTVRQMRTVTHPLLSRLYPQIQTLRDYVLSRLLASSRLRRKKIASVGLQAGSTDKTVTDRELAVARLLDTTVVACSPQTAVQPDNRWEQWTSFSQKGDESYVSLSEGSKGDFSQTEVCSQSSQNLFRCFPTNRPIDRRFRYLATLLKGEEDWCPSKALAL